MDNHTYTRLVFRHCMDTSGGQPAVPEVCSQTGRRYFPLQRSPTQLDAALIEPATSKSPYFIGAEELMNTFLITPPGQNEEPPGDAQGSGCSAQHHPVALPPLLFVADKPAVDKHSPGRKEILPNFSLQWDVVLWNKSISCPSSTFTLPN